MDNIKERLKDMNIDIKVATEMSCDRDNDHTALSSPSARWREI